MFENKETAKYIIIYSFVLIWLYLSICLILVGMNGSWHIKNMPIMDEMGMLQTLNFIPLCIFTNYFDEKYYIFDKGD